MSTDKPLYIPYTLDQWTYLACQQAIMHMENSTSNVHPGAELPKYKCYKEVWALKIKAIEGVNQDPIVRVVLSFEEPGYEPIVVEKDWWLKHLPQVGGYLVVYKDGYRSYSPAKAFEEGYTKI